MVPQDLHFEQLLERAAATLSPKSTPAASPGQPAEQRPPAGRVPYQHAVLRNRDDVAAELRTLLNEELHARFLEHAKLPQGRAQHDLGGEAAQPGAGAVRPGGQRARERLRVDVAEVGHGQPEPGQFGVERA